MLTLKRGETFPLSQLTPAHGLRIALATAPGLRCEFCCFGLDENRRLRDESYLVSARRRASPFHAIQVVGERAGEAMTFAVDLALLPAFCQRLVFTLSVAGEGKVSDLSGGQWSLLAQGVEVARFNFAGREFGAEKSVVIGEIYLHHGAWRVAATGLGFRDDLDALTRHFGGQISPKSSSVVAAAPAGEVCCVRCGQSEGVLGRFGFNALDRATKRCKSCEAEVRLAFERLRADFGSAWHQGVLSTAEWNALWIRFEAARTGATRSQAMEWLRPDALRFMERLVAMATSHGVIIPAEEAYVRQMSAFLELPGAMQTPFLARLEHVKATAAIREGRLPRVSVTDTHLDAGELCHLDVPATYYKVTERSTKRIAGRMMATSKKLIFLSPNGGWTIQFKNIMSAQATKYSLDLQLATRSGNGSYSVADAQWCEAVVTTLTRMAKRQLLTPQSDNPTRHIPQDVKNAVWQRDGGRCVQCAADSYLEFDHILPFSKGGANTYGNIQLLCRKCNGEKGDRI